MTCKAKLRIHLCVAIAASLQHLLELIQLQLFYPFVPYPPELFDDFQLPVSSPLVNSQCVAPLVLVTFSHPLGHLQPWPTQWLVQNSTGAHSLSKREGQAFARHVVAKLSHCPEKKYCYR